MPYRAIVVTDNDVEQDRPAIAEQQVEGVLLSYVNDVELTSRDDGGSDPDVVLLDMESLDNKRAGETAERCKELRLPVVAIVPAERVGEYDPRVNPDDFVLQPFRPGELAARINIIMHRAKRLQSSKVITAGDVEIDLEGYEVTVSGRRVLLTYKEYQLLVLLASNPGRVYSREALLAQIWGYDYFGGIRTVDVHIRRLRSKLETGGRTFIETVWNVGYRLNVKA